MPVQAFPVTWTGLFTSDHLTGGYGSPGPFGSVVLTESGTAVDFVVTLNDGSKFVRTGAGDGMNFKFNSTGIADLTEITGTGLTADTGSFSGGGGGLFDYGVFFTGQKNGGGAGIAGPIRFSVANATISDFINATDLAHNGKNQLFVADVISGIIIPGNTVGNTGLIDVSGQVPIPAAAWLLGTGIIGLVGIRRKFKK